MNFHHCEQCPLYGVTIPYEVSTDDEARFMVVTDRPIKTASGDVLPLSAVALKALGKGLSAVGYARREFRIVPYVRCVYDEAEYPSKDRKSIVSACRNHLLDEISRLQPDAVIPTGSGATSQVIGKPIKITKERGILRYSSELGCYVFPMLSSVQVALYPQHEVTFATDCKTFSVLDSHGFDARKAEQGLLGSYSFIDDLQFIIDAKPKVLCIDIEATGLRHYYKGKHDVRDFRVGIDGKEFDPSAAVLTIQFCYEPGVAYMLVWDHPERPVSRRDKARLTRQLRTLFSDPDITIVNQNLKFDCTYIAANIGVRLKIGGDTLMLAALIDENAISKGQDILVKKYVPELAGYADIFNNTVDKSRMWEVPLDKLLNYGCGDVDSGLRLYHVLYDEVASDKKLLAHYEHVSLPGLNTFASIELNGIYVDYAALDAFEQLMDETVKEQYRNLLRQVPKSIKRKHIDKGSKKGETGLRFSRDEFVKDILFNHKDGFRLKPKVFTKGTAKLAAHLRVPSVSTKDHLPYFFEECPFTVELAEYVKNERLLGTSIRGFKKKYIVDDLVRSVYSLWTTVTGRSSSEDPNGQNFPKRGKNAIAYRRSFVAPPGYFVLEADLSQAELRIAADMANDRTMLSIYRNNGDIHLFTAAAVTGISYQKALAGLKDIRKLMDCSNEWPGSGAYLRQLNPGQRGDALVKDYIKLKRFQAKAINFGFLYGMWWKKFIVYAKTQYGVDFEPDEAAEIRETFFTRYAELSGWHDRVREYVMEHGMVRSYSGRIRHLPMVNSSEEYVVQEALRQGINSPVQEFASSLGVASMGRLNEEVDPYWMRPVAFVHDAIYCYVRKEALDWGVRTLKWYMESNPIEEWFGVRMKCPIVADVSFGLNFGDTIELPGLSIDNPYDFGSIDEVSDYGIIIPTQVFPPRNGLLA